jgi:hypothetical protein
MDNPENTEGAITNGQSRETGNRVHKAKTNKTTTQHNMCWLSLSKSVLFVLSCYASLRSEFLVVMSVTISAEKRYLVRLYLQLFVGGIMSYLRYVWFVFTFNCL